MEQKWVGEVCDICGQKFTEKDEVAICPDCGAPYHRACIAEKKECVHAELHQTGKAWQSKRVNEKPKDDGILCPRCHKMNTAGSHFCSGCGLPLGNKEDGPVHIHLGSMPGMHPGAGEGAPFSFETFLKNAQYGGLDPEEKVIDDVTAKEAAAYVKKNPQYFLPRFKVIRHRGFSMNISAMLFGGLYYLYRKVYGFGILLLAVQLLLSIPAFIIGMSYAAQMMNLAMPFSFDMNMISNVDMFCSFIRMTVMFLSGAFFNHLYRNHVGAKVKKARAKAANDDEKLKRLNASGGVNFALVMVLLIAYIALYYLAVLFLMHGGK